MNCTSSHGCSCLSCSFWAGLWFCPQSGCIPWKREWIGSVSYLSQDGAAFATEHACLGVTTASNVSWARVYEEGTSAKMTCPESQCFVAQQLGGPYGCSTEVNVFLLSMLCSLVVWVLLVYVAASAKLKTPWLASAAGSNFQLLDEQGEDTCSRCRFVLHDGSRRSFCDVFTSPVGGGRVCRGCQYGAWLGMFAFAYLASQAPFGPVLFFLSLMGDSFMSAMAVLSISVSLIWVALAAVVSVFTPWQFVRATLCGVFKQDPKRAGPVGDMLGDFHLSRVIGNLLLTGEKVRYCHNTRAKWHNFVTRHEQVASGSAACCLLLACSIFFVCSASGAKWQTIGMLFVHPAIALAGQVAFFFFMSANDVIVITDRRIFVGSRYRVSYIMPLGTTNISLHVQCCRKPNTGYVTFISTTHQHRQPVVVEHVPQLDLIIGALAATHRPLALQQVSYSRVKWARLISPIFLTIGPFLLFSAFFSLLMGQGYWRWEGTGTISTFGPVLLCVGFAFAFAFSSVREMFVTHEKFLVVSAEGNGMPLVAYVQRPSE